MLVSILLNVFLAGIAIGLGVALRHARSRQREQHIVIRQLRVESTQLHGKVRDAISRCRSRLDAGIST